MKLMRRVALLATLVVGVCSAGVIAVAPNGGSAGSDGRPFMIGWQFSVSTALQLDGLAYFDVGSDGLGEAHQVGIFDSASGALLISATVPDGTSGTLVDGFRVIPISFLLGPGTYVIGGQQLSGADESIVFAPSVTSIAGVSYLQERELQTSSFAMPTVNVPSTEKGIFGPSFTVGTTVPEPGSLALVIASIGLLYGSRGRRKKVLD